MNIIGDIEGKVCIVPDDIIDTAGTLCNAANALKEKGAHIISISLMALATTPPSSFIPRHSLL